MRPGAILGSQTGTTEDPASSDVRIFRIRRDFATADLLLDAAEMNSIHIKQIKPKQLDDTREQYKKDWIEWPAHKGAPFYDSEGDGKYSPKFIVKSGKEIPVLYPDADEPGITGADQVIWYEEKIPERTKSRGMQRMHRAESIITHCVSEVLRRQERCCC